MTQQQKAVRDQRRLKRIGFVFPQLFVPECIGEPVFDTTVPEDDWNDYEMQQAVSEGRLIPFAAT